MFLKRSAYRLALAVASGAFFQAGVAYAQGCALCYTTAAAANAAGIQALRSGILVLLIPPVLMTLGIFSLALVRQGRFNDEGAGAREVPRRPQKLSEWLSGSAAVAAAAGPAAKTDAPSRPSSFK